MAMLNCDMLKRFHYLSLVARQSGGRSLLAAGRTKPSGGGTEVTGLRDYSPGDDYRSIDWIWCARRDELLTKTFAGDEDRSVYVLLDCSRSMGLGRPSKFHIARQIAAVLGYQALMQSDRLAVVAFSDGIVAQSPAIRHKARLPILLRFLGQLRVQGNRTDLARAVEGFVRRRQRPGPVAVIGDLYDPGGATLPGSLETGPSFGQSPCFDQSSSSRKHGPVPFCPTGGFARGVDMLLAHGYEPRVVQIHDPAEARPAMLGDLELYDVESEISRRVTITERARERYVQLFAEFHRSVRTYCARRGVACLQIGCDTPEDEVLLRVLGARRPEAKETAIA